MTDVVHAQRSGAHPDHTGYGRRWDEAKAELLARTVSLAEAADPALPPLVERFYRHVAPEDMLGREPTDLLGAVTSQLRLAEGRPQGTTLVRTFTPTVAEQGWECGHTVIEVVTDDMPFLVDSVTGELSRTDRGVHVVIHPLLVVRRDLMGTLLEIVDAEPDAPDLASDAVVESWIHVEIDRLPDPTDAARVERDLQRVLRDVRDSVEDWPRTRRRALELADALAADPPGLVPTEEVSDAVELLRWLAADHFTFLGYREYRLEGSGLDQRLVAVPGTGLGILRADTTQSTSFAKLRPQARELALSPRLLVLTKANSRSTVHRTVYLDYVGVKTFDAEGRVTGERRFLGLYTAAAYNASVQSIPVLSRKVATVVGGSGFPPDSHDGKDLQQFLETYPRDELFEITSDELLDVSLHVLHLGERRQTRLFLRTDPFGRYVSAMIYLPRDRYNTRVRQRMEAILREATGAESIEHQARVSDSVLARLHFVARLPHDADVPVLDPEDLERRLSDATRSWTDEFAHACNDQLGEEQGAALFKRYADSFPEAYKEDFPARTAVADAHRLDALADDEMAVSLYQQLGAPSDSHRFKVFRVGDAMSLSEMLPVLQYLGVDVVDERPYGVRRPNGRKGWIYDFGLRYDARGLPEADTLRTRFEEAFVAAWDGRLERDGFDALVGAAGLHWRQVCLVQAYMGYLRQLGSTFSQRYTEQVLWRHAGCVRDIVSLFETRFDPDVEVDEHGRDRVQRSAALEHRIRAELDGIASLDEDRIVRSLFTVVLATLRTSYYRLDDAGRPPAAIAVKVDPSAIPDAPLPRPRFEIWVHSPRVAGVHLRFGKVARGGLRWSDRREDFRTEVLGLVKAQMVKNAVIVPVGAKGGFVVKNPPTGGDREAVLAEGIACYRLFVSSLLDVTDNLVHGEVVPPPRVVRRDADDTYLVVAADKGTATFSDIANDVAASYGFWLGDAFASGGSAGYDHKAMGITARGAWESVKRHFRELGVDTQSQDVTVVGIGDMSGDVFGNGMLLSEHIRLVAAFDHRHIFLDPSPDAAASFAERRRLFELPRSSWADYDQDLISAGGGVHSRAVKSIALTPPVRDVLGIPAGVDAMTPHELMRAILTAPVDLLWNGGIGTYVKAGAESNADVGDKANDPIRIDGSEIRARVVGEGGNLGLTQLGRIEAAEAGVRLNTDAIDNSAGVDTSDHEVNIKVLLDGVVADGDLTTKQRNALLADMTDEVATHVLRDNYLQNVALGNARVQSPGMLPVHQRLIRELEADGRLDRRIEFLPSDAEIEARVAAGRGLTSPELSVLFAYAKISLTDELLESTLATESWCSRVARHYFPGPLVTRFEDRLPSHPLHREIVLTVLANDVINRGGTSFVFRAQEETGASAVEVARAFAVSRAVFDLPRLWERVEALDNAIPTAAQTELQLEIRRLLDRSVRWLLQIRGGTVDVDAEVARFREHVRRIGPEIPSILIGVEADRLRDRTAELVDIGAPEELALEVAALLDTFSVLDAVEIGRRTGTDPLDVTRLYFVMSERFDIDVLLRRISALERPDRWAALARAALRSDLYAAHAGLTQRVIQCTPDGGEPMERIEAWEHANAEGLARARATLDEITALDEHDLATISVALRTIRTLVSQSAG